MMSQSPANAHCASIHLTCPAKVNLALSIGSPDARGYHPLASWMVAVAFGDEMTLERLDGQSDTVDHGATDEKAGSDAISSSIFDIAYAADAPCACPVDWPLQKDLAYRALKRLETHLGYSLRVRCTLRKRIPTGAGLGGGSTNAAGMLVGLNRLFDLQIAPEMLCQLASQLGSDVAFSVGSLTGTPSAIVTDFGETLEAVTGTGATPLVLIFPQLACSTAEVYQQFDQLTGADRRQIAPDLARVRLFASQNPPPQDGPFNDLAEPAFEVSPELRAAYERVASVLDLPVHVTGSGSTLFVIAPTAISAKALARKIMSTTGLAAIATRTL